jgi:hypothetical protein
LAQFGFKPVGGTVVGGQKWLPAGSAFVLTLTNQRNKDVAAAIVVTAKGPFGLPVKVRRVELGTRFRSGTVIRTDNSKVLDPFPHPPGETVAEFPTIVHADELYRLHQALVKREGDGSGRVLRFDEEFHGDLTALLEHRSRERLEARAAAGYVYFSPISGVYRYTFKGAFVLVWGLLPPFSFLHRWRRHRRAKRLIAELESQL